MAQTRTCKEAFWCLNSRGEWYKFRDKDGWYKLRDWQGTITCEQRPD